MISKNLFFPFVDVVVSIVGQRRRRRRRWYNNRQDKSMDGKEGWGGVVGAHSDVQWSVEKERGGKGTKEKDFFIKKCLMEVQ